MKPDTFGRFPAGESLCKILDELKSKGIKCNPQPTFNDYMRTHNEVRKSIKDSKICFRLLWILRKEYVERINKSNFPDIVKQHLSNVIIATHRDYMRYYLL